MPRAKQASHISIRRAAIHDLPELIALETSCFQNDRLSPRQYSHHIDSTSAQVLIASQARHCTGSSLVFFRRNSVIARLYSIAVSPRFQGFGVGSKLLRSAESRAKARGAQVMRLEVRQDNTQAIAWYEKSGYRRIGTYSRYYADGADAWRYEKKL